MWAWDGMGMGCVVCLFSDGDVCSISRPAQLLTPRPPPRPTTNDKRQATSDKRTYIHTHTPTHRPTRATTRPNPPHKRQAKQRKYIYLSTHRDIVQLPRPAVLLVDGDHLVKTKEKGGWLVDRGVSCAAEKGGLALNEGVGCRYPTGQLCVCIAKVHMCIYLSRSYLPVRLPVVDEAEHAQHLHLPHLFVSIFVFYVRIHKCVRARLACGHRAHDALSSMSMFMSTCEPHRASTIRATIGGRPSSQPHTQKGAQNQSRPTH